MRVSYLFAQAGLEAGEGTVLAALWEADGASTASLADRVHVSEDLVQRLVDRLGLLGYVECEREPAEGVWLTTDGFRLRTEAAQAVARFHFSLS